MFKQLRRLLAPPIFADEERTRIAQILNAFIWSAIGILSVFIVARAAAWNENGYVPLLVLLGIVIFLGAGQIMLRRGYVNRASIFLVGALWAAMTYQAWEADGLHDAAVFAYKVVVIFSSLLLGWRAATILGGMSLAVVWYFAVMEERGARILHVDSPFNYARDLSIIFVLIGVLLYLLISNWTRTLKAARLELQERLRAEEKLQRQADYLTAVNEVALGLLNRLELQPLLESILTRACNLIDTKYGSIDLVLPDGSALRQEVGNEFLARYNGTVTLKNKGMMGSVWACGETLVIRDYSTWEKGLPEFIEAGIKSVMGVPLKVGNTVIGVLAVSYTEKGRTFTQEQVNLIERFAALASLAIDNARLYEQAQKEIRERSMVEVELRASEERFRKVFQSSPAAIVISSLGDGRVIEANDAYWNLTGFDPQKSVGHTALELGIWNNEDERRAFVDQLKQKRSLYAGDYQFKNKDGALIPTIAFYELVQLDNMDCVLSMFYDITDQKIAQQSLKNSEARTRAILNSIPDMIFEISSDGTFLDFMASAELTSVMPASQFIGKNVKEMFPPAIAEQTLFMLERALDTEQVNAFEYELSSGGENQFFEARISAITPQSAIMMVRDISQRKWVATEREKLINELEGKNSELERFTYTVSHDLKSPLITIKGFLGFLEQDAANGNIVRLKADIQRISNATEKMQLLLNDLLELSRVGRLVNPSQSVNFQELVREAIELVHGQIQSRGIQISIQENLPAVYGDKQRLVEVLQNLIDNAAKFMGDQSVPRIEIGLNGYERGLPVFYVRDNGIGIDPAHHDRIFGLFNKLDAASEGTGIGLALVKRIIEIHGGRIWVQSETDKGATFFFTLRVESAS